MISMLITWSLMLGLITGTFIGTLIGRKKRHQRYPHLKKEELKWGRPIGKVLDNQGQVDTFILDFEKAFDAPLH